MHDAVKVAQEIGDMSSIGIVAGTFLGILPYLAAALSIIWTGIRIYVWIEERLEKRAASSTDNQKDTPL